MEFEFGTNWATYSKYVGDVFGSALAAEGIFAFALEVVFLVLSSLAGIVLSPDFILLPPLGVWLGSMFSAVWIVVANSWQQTPAGFHIMGTGLSARAEITDFWLWCLILPVWIGCFMFGSGLFFPVHFSS